MFKIKDLEFDIEHAYLDAYVSDLDGEMVFGLQIKTKEKEDVFLGYSAHFETDMLLNIKPNEITKWQDIAGRKVEWEDYLEDEEEPDGFLYIFEHEAVYNAKIEIKNIDNRIYVKIDALCDVYFDDDYSDNLPLKIETEIDFYGIPCGKNTSENDCINEIKPYLDVSNFRYVKNKYDVSLMIPKDSDMETNLLLTKE